MGRTYLHLPVNTWGVFTLQSLHLPSTFKFCILNSWSGRWEVSRSCLVVGFAFHTFVNKWNNFHTIRLSGFLMPPLTQINQHCYSQLNLSPSSLEGPGNRLATHEFAFEIISSASFSLSPLFFCCCFLLLFVFATCFELCSCFCRQVSSDGTPVVAVTKVQIPDLWCWSFTELTSHTTLWRQTLSFLARLRITSSSPSEFGGGGGIMW